VILAYHQAAAGQTTQTHYDLFWLGMTLMTVPLWLTLLGARTGPRATTLVVVGLGLAAYFPRFLRSPSAPVMHDELGHWLAAQKLYTSGRLLQPDPVVTMARYYQGLETLTVGLRKLSGLSTYEVAVVVLACFHVLTVLGVFHLTRRVLSDIRVAGLAAAIYAISPSFPFLDGMFAYESFGVPLVVWALVAAVSALQTTSVTQRVWLGACLVLGICAVVTHHLSSYVLICLLAALGLIHLAFDRRSGRRAHAVPVLAVSGLLAGAAGVWVYSLGVPIVTYLGYFPKTAAAGLGGIFDKITGHPVQPTSVVVQNPTATRTLFSGSRLPDYEQVAAYAAQPLLLAGFGYGVWKRRSNLDANFVLLALLGFAYFVSLPLVLNPAGSAGAHRSWTYIYIGLAPVVAIGVNGLIRPGARWSGGRRALCALCLLTVLAGNYAAQVNDSERFPGPFVFGSDGRSVSPELISLAQWFRTAEGTNQIVLTDFRTFTAFGAYADAIDTPGFPAWDVFFPVVAGSSDMEHLVVRSGARFLIVDNRLATTPPERGYYFSPQEPATLQPLPELSITKFATYPWLHVIHTTDHYVVYAVDTGAPQ